MTTRMATVFGMLATAAVLGVAACGAVRPDRGDGASNVPATAGGLAGAAEGSPGNANNLGSNGSTIVPSPAGK